VSHPWGIEKQGGFADCVSHAAEDPGLRTLLVSLDPRLSLKYTPLRFVILIAPKDDYDSKKGGYDPKASHPWAL